jgi:huntingtin-interacting protein 1-related protein
MVVPLPPSKLAKKFLMFYQPPGTAKQEDELAQSIKKALTADETAPKQKHVRACILYTWDVKGPGSFFHALKSFPMLSDEVIAFKSLITYHKVLRQGHPNVELIK